MVQAVFLTDGLFKREYKRLKDGFAFAVIADLDKEIAEGTEDVVMMGQSKVPFVARFSQYTGPSLEDKVQAILKKTRTGRLPR